jgi:glycosyltransferase involved in cell wall biosynthesis
MLGSLPIISVILPNYNHSKYLDDCISRILGQDYTNIELIIVDDASTDGSRDVIKRIASVDTRVRAFFFDKNCGAVLASKFALERGTGSLLYQAAADDFLIDKSFFSDAVRAFRENQFIGVAYGQSVVIDAVSEVRTRVMGHGKVGYISPSEFISGFLDLSAPFFVPGASCVMRVDEFRRIDGYDSRLGPQIDYFVNHAIPSTAGAVFFRNIVTAVREFSDNSNFSSSLTLQQELQHFRCFAEKMMGMSHHHSNVGQWESWWENRYARLVTKHFPFRRLV